MISVLSTTKKYQLQNSLLDMHRRSLDWLSATILWKRELAFFQKLLDQHASQFTDVNDKKAVDHFQNLLTYYGGELVDAFRSKLRDHESHLAHTLQRLNESDTEYFQHHKDLMDELAAFDKQFHEFKHDFFQLIEKSLDS